MICEKAKFRDDVRISTATAVTSASSSGRAFDSSNLRRQQAGETPAKSSSLYCFRHYLSLRRFCEVSLKKHGYRKTGIMADSVA